MAETCPCGIYEARINGKCGICAEHREDCRLRISATCAVGIECEHGRSFCPECDPCTCKEPPPS